MQKIFSFVFVKLKSKKINNLIAQITQIILALLF